MEWFRLAQDRDKWPAVVNMVTKFGVPHNVGKKLHKPLVQTHDWLIKCLYVRVDIVFGLSVFVFVNLFQILFTVLF